MTKTFSQPMNEIQSKRTPKFFFENSGDIAIYFVVLDL